MQTNEQSTATDQAQQPHYEAPPVLTTTEAVRPVAPNDEPSKRLACVLTGKDYLKYVTLSERVRFSVKVTGKQKDEALIKKALELLERRLEEEFMKSGQLFVNIENL